MCTPLSALKWNLTHSSSHSTAVTSTGLDYFSPTSVVTIGTRTSCGSPAPVGSSCGLGPARRMWRFPVSGARIDVGLAGRHVKKYPADSLPAASPPEVWWHVSTASSLTYMYNSTPRTDPSVLLLFEEDWLLRTPQLQSEIIGDAQRRIGIIVDFAGWAVLLPSAILWTRWEVTELVALVLLQFLGRRRCAHWNPGPGAQVFGCEPFPFGAFTADIAACTGIVHILHMMHA